MIMHGSSQSIKNARFRVLVRWWMLLSSHGILTAFSWSGREDSLTCVQYSVLLDFVVLAACSYRNYILNQQFFNANTVPQSLR